ncbi:type IV pilus secretin PilQ [Vibrio sp. DNF-1]|nr:type IV pilus secretin PilQ [Vibrio salinus]MCE0493964.1 type IV pilus secretin PilQ [Vibrio salinus]
MPEKERAVNQSKHKVIHKQSRYFRLRHTDSEQVYKMLSEQQGFLSQSGSVTFDTRTNTLVVFDYPDVMKRIESLIQNIDCPAKLVEIEARIVMVNEGALDELGVQWGVISHHQNASITGRIASGGQVEENSYSDRMAVTLPASSANASSIAFQLASLGTGTLLDLELSALQSESKAEVISSPRLLTMNNKPAFIEQGTEIPYLESNKDGEQTIAFKKAVLSLKVTPKMNTDDKMTLDLLVTQDRPGQVVKTGTGEAVAIITQRIGSQVMAKDGETIVLGGIFQKNTTKNTDKVPLLGDLPLVGPLFRRSYENTGKSELVIFVTPRTIIQ